MNRTWRTQSYVARGAQVLSHQNLHTYITLHYSTLHYIKVHYIAAHYITVHYSTFPVLFPHCASLSWFPLYYPVALPRRWVEVLEPTVEKIDDLGLVPIFKKYFNKKYVIFLFLLRFMYRHFSKSD